MKPSKRGLRRFTGLRLDRARPSMDSPKRTMIEEEPYFRKILEHILNEKGFDGNQYKLNYIKRRLAVRMRATGSRTYMEYLRVLHKNLNEVSLLFDRLTIHVTDFFRDADVYQSLKVRVLPEIIRSPETHLKVWCAGCSTGQEPYSVAITLKESTLENEEFDFGIIATDIDESSIRAAERGVYPKVSLNKLTKSQILKWFSVEEEQVRVSEELRKHIRFKTHDLLGRWNTELSGFQLILCRNLFIYLTSTQQQKLYERFSRALKPCGYLVLGLTETLMGKARDLFHCVDVRNRIYQAYGQD